MNIMGAISSQMIKQFTQELVETKKKEIQNSENWTYIHQLPRNTTAGVGPLVGRCHQNFPGIFHSAPATQLAPTRPRLKALC